MKNAPEYELPELTETHIRERIHDYWIWAEPNQDSQINLELAIEEMFKHEDDYACFFVAIQLLVMDGKLPELKKYMDEYIRSSVENGEDSWS